MAPRGDSVIQVGATIDLSQILPGMDLLAAKTTETTTKMASSMVEGATSAIPLGQAFDGVSDKLNLIGVGVEDAAEKMERNFVEARHSAMLLSENIGIGLPRALAAVLARSASVGPVLEAIFPIVVAITFIKLFADLYEKLEKAHEKILMIDVGWSKLDASFGTFDRNLKQKLDTSSEKILELTRGPLAAMDQKIKDITFDIDTFSNHMNSGFENFAKQITATGNLGFWHMMKEVFWNAGMSEQEIINKTKEFQLAYDRAGDSVESKTKVITEAQDNVRKRLEDLNTLQEIARMNGAKGNPELIADYNRLLQMLERMNAELQKGVDITTGQQEVAYLEMVNHAAELMEKEKQSRIDNAKSSADAVAAAQEKGATDSYNLAKISLSQETSALVEAEDLRYNTLVQGNAKKRAILQDQLARGKEVGAEIIKLDGDVVTARIEHEAKINSIAAAAELERKNLIKDEYEFWLNIENQKVKKQTDDIISDIEARRAYREQSYKISQDSATSEIENSRRAASADAQLQQLKIEGTDATARQKAEANAAVQSAELQRERELADQKLRIQLDYIEKMKAELLGGESEESFISRAGPHEAEALAKLQGLHAESEAAQRAHEQEMGRIKEQSLLNDQRLANAQAQINRTLTQDLTRNYLQTFNDIVVGQEKVGLAFANMGARIVQTVVQNLQTMALKWASHFLLVEILEKTSIGRRLASILAGEAIKKGVQTAAGAAEVAKSAGIGYAASFASVLAALPFPANVATAPGVAAAESAAIMGGGLAMVAAEKGALLNADMPVYAHAKELILPAPISTGLQEMIASGDHRPGREGGAQQSDEAPSGDIHFHVAVSAIDGTSVRDFFDNNEDLFAEMLEKATRNRAYR